MPPFLAVAEVRRCSACAGSGPQLEALLGDSGAPLRAALLVHQPKAELLVQVPCRVEAFECPEMNPVVPPGPAEPDGRREQSVSDACAAHLVRRDEPAQVCAISVRMRTVDGDRALDSVIGQREPKAVTLLSSLLNDRAMRPARPFDLKLDVTPEQRDKCVVIRVRSDPVPEHLFVRPDTDSTPSQPDAHRVDGFAR